MAETLRTRSSSESAALRSVLVVEDDRDLREALADLLRLEGGYAVSEAENGIDALLFLRTAPVPDLVILDLDLPLMDGEELLAQIGADPTLARLPVVIVSSRETIRLAADAVFHKPCHPEALLAALRRLSGGRAAEADDTRG
jgi:DNA-binding response OmpR family regulator